MKWFKKKPSKEAVREDSRALLTQRRFTIETDIIVLEDKAESLLQQGKEATSPITKRRLAAQINQVRKDIERFRTTVTMLNQQINVSATDAHNVAIIKAAKVAQLPSTAELTEHAVEAEQIVEAIKADAEMVNGFENNQASLTDEEEAIMKEFETKEEETTEDAIIQEFDEVGLRIEDDEKVARFEKAAAACEDLYVDHLDNTNIE